MRLSFHEFRGSWAPVLGALALHALVLTIGSSLRPAKITASPDELPAQRNAERETEISLVEEIAGSVVKEGASVGWPTGNTLPRRSVDQPAAANLREERVTTGNAEPGGTYSLDPSASEGPADASISASRRARG